MSYPSTTGLPCRFIVGVHTEGSWQGHPKPCGMKRGTIKDPRSERYDDGLCPTHLALVVQQLADQVGEPG